MMAGPEDNKEAQANTPPQGGQLGLSGDYTAHVRGAYEYIQGGGEILFGVFLCFYGGSMINITIKILLFAGITAFLFLGFQSVNDEQRWYPDFAEKQQQAMMIVGGVSALIGVIGSHFASKIVTKENILKLIGGMVFGFAGFVLISGVDIPGWAKYIVAVASGIAGALLLRGNETTIIGYGTAFIGSLLMAHGLNNYIGGFPSFSSAKELEDQKLTTEFLGYLAGIIVFTIIGGNVQIKRQAASDGDFFAEGA